jgi:hypothetical protein
MKTSFLVVSLALLPVAGFSQGKVIFGNDSNHLIVLTNNPAELPPEWASLAGQAVPQSGGANPLNMGLFTAELWAGTSAANLTPVSSITADGLFGLPDGRLANHNIILPWFGTVTFKIDIWETAGPLAGESPIFTAVTGSLLYNPLTLARAPSNSTWANGPIVLSYIPEPCSLALAGVGALVWGMCRRRANTGATCFLLRPRR